jgi:hypothetical protein
MNDEMRIAIGLGLCVLGAMISVTAAVCIVRKLWLKHKQNKERRKR